VLTPAAQPLSPIVVRVVGETPADIGVIDILYGAIGITGIMLIGSAILGGLLGLLFILVRKRLDAREPPHSPSSAYGFTPGPSSADTNQD
jgi:hypothetical protein